MMGRVLPLKGWVSELVGVWMVRGCWVRSDIVQRVEIESV
jgi:hypothetical protein